MEYLKSLAYSLITVSVCCTFINLLLKNNKFVSSVKLITSLILSLVIITFCSPLFNALSELTLNYPKIPENSDQITSFDENNYKLSAKGICLGIKELISIKYQIPKDNIYVSVTVNTDDLQNIYLKSVTVTITYRSEYSGNDIAKYVEDTLCCSCTVIKK